MSSVVVLTDRAPEVVLPALADLPDDVKVAPLSIASVEEISRLSPAVVLVDAAEVPGQGFLVLRAVAESGALGRAVAVVERMDLQRFDWDDVADDVVYPSAPPAELQLRLRLARRRRGGGDGSTIRLGPLVLDIDAYRVTVAGRALDLTYKEFELLRFLASRPGRAFTRPALLREVWGYDFYGGTRTVDVHVRRLRSKLGPEHEGLVQTVRGVGYRALDA
jgi:DNA-binding response OmpR family regulator